nr:MAG TPA: hypothetical protein [Caudoviricetes sp.]
MTTFFSPFSSTSASTRSISFCSAFLNEKLMTAFTARTPMPSAAATSAAVILLS